MEQDLFGGRPEVGREEKPKFQSIVGQPLSDAPKVGYLSGKHFKHLGKNQKTFSDATSLLNYEFALDEGAREFEAATKAQAIQRAQAREQYIQQMKARDIQMNAQLKAYGESQQRVANQLKFNQAGAERALGDAQTVLGDRLTQIDFQAEGIDLQEREQTLNTASAIAQADLAEFQALQQKTLSDAEADRNFATSNTAAQLEFEQQTTAAQFQLQQQRDQTAFQQQQVRLESLANRGTARALGRRGVSAGRTEQSILALAGINTAQLSQSLLRFETEETKQAGLRQRGLDVRKQTARDARTTAKSRGKASLNIAKAEADITRNRATEIQAIANARFSMNRRELGETMLSALNGYKQSKEQIFLDKFKADSQAYASRMAEPQYADAPKKPFELPELKFITPPLPLETPENTPYQQKQPKTSIFGKILQIGGAVLSAAAIPLTGGTSTGLAIGLATGGAAMSGIGSTGWFTT
tara:strand:+ start:2772 stop:4181 length:1410 start_codon:yes stop_codon:yes gene_type:complete